MTSDELVQFVVDKLAEHGAAKVMPDEPMLSQTFAAFVRGERARARFAEETPAIPNVEKPLNS